MKKYFYAQTYLRVLLLLAAWVVIGGVAFASIQVMGILSDIHDYQISKHAPLIIDTQGLVNELDAASDVVRAFTSKSQPYDFASELKKRNIENGEAAELRHQQIDSFENYLQIARNDSNDLKMELLKDFQATLNDIETAVRSVLNSAESGSATTASGTAAVRERQPEAQAKGLRRQLYSPEALAEIQFDELNMAVSFLRKGPQNDIANYISPQAEMRAAADELQALLQLIHQEATRLKEEQQVHLITNEEQAAPILVTASTKVAVLRRFLNELSLCEELAKVNISRGWIVDAQIDKAENSITRFRAERSERLSSLRSQMLHSAMLTGISVLSTAIVALLLLMIRDFLSALIDTAVNTGATVNALDKIRQAGTSDEVSE